jgi:molybdopterin converting factor small subunit
MEIEVYGRLTDIMGNQLLNTDGIENTDQLKNKLLSLYPGLSRIDYAIAVNNQIIKGNQSLLKEDIVSLLPPFSGG